MKKLVGSFIFLCCLLSGLEGITQNAMVTIRATTASEAGCTLVTDCDNDFVCYNLFTTVDQTKNLDSYNIWVKYDQAVLSRVDGGNDESCVLMDGGDTNVEDSSGAYRVAATNDQVVTLNAGEEYKIHTICFNIIDRPNFNGTEIIAGGDMFGDVLKTTITFSDATLDDTVPESTVWVVDEPVDCLMAPLPIELTSFTGRPEGTHNILEWVTRSERNNDYFSLERSEDGHHFESIGKIEGKGTSSYEQHYDFTDENPPLLSYYRLRQVDYDGNSSLSEVITISRKEVAGDPFLVNTYYPVPTQDKVVVQMQTAQSGTLNFILTDIMGRRLMVDKVNVSEGAFNYEVDLHDMPSGVYFLKVDHPLQTRALKLVRQ